MRDRGYLAEKRKLLSDCGQQLFYSGLTVQLSRSYKQQGFAQAKKYI
jgi:hypothetical protein